VRRMTRRMARAWLSPMRACLQAIRDTGCADEIDGHPVTRLHARDDYARVDECLAGFLGLMDRLCPQINTAPLHRIQMRLEAGELLTVALIDEAMRVLRAVESHLLRHPVADVHSAVLAEQIQIEFDEMKEAA